MSRGTLCCVILASILAAACAAGEAEKPPTGGTDAGVHADRVIARMRALQEQQQWQKLIEEFQNEEIAGWPPEAADKAGEAFHRRGQAYARMKQGKKAEADLRMAVKRSARNELFWLNLAENYRNNLKDDEQALDAYLQTMTLAGVSTNWLPLTATLSAANILCQHGKYDRALEVLGRYKDLDRVSKFWRITMLRTYGHIYAGQGREKDAMAKFNQALRLEESP